MIRVDAVHKRFTVPARGWRRERAAPVVAVERVSFVAGDGRITGLLGPNGAGKTTTLRMVAGLIEADGGSIEVDGIDARREPQRALRRMGVLSDARGLYPRLSARENIVYYARLHGMDRDAAHARAETLAVTLDWTNRAGLKASRQGCKLDSVSTTARGIQRITAIGLAGCRAYRVAILIIGSDGHASYTTVSGQRNLTTTTIGQCAVEIAAAIGIVIFIHSSCDG